MKNQTILRVLAASFLVSGPVLSQGVNFPKDAEGFSIINPSTDSRIIYVSSSIGNNAYTGLCPTVQANNCGPKATIHAGRDLLRNGFPDHLRIRRGDVFHTETETDSWYYGLGPATASGRSAVEPIVYEAYGPVSDPRPLIYVGTDGAGFLERVAHHNPSHIAILSVELTPAPGAEGSGSGISLYGPMSDLLIEDVNIHHFHLGVWLEHDLYLGQDIAPDHITIRRSIVADSFGNARAQGLLMGGATNLVVDESIFLCNGWKCDPSLRSTEAHAFYLHHGAHGLRITNSIVAQNSYQGIGVNSGHDVLVQNNLLIENPMNLRVRTHPSQTADNNVIFSLSYQPGVDIGAGRTYDLKAIDTAGMQGADDPVGDGFIPGTANITNNLVISEVPNSPRAAISLDSNSPANSSAVHSIRNNVVYGSWEYGSLVTYGPGVGDPVILEGNAFVNPDNNQQRVLSIGGVASSSISFNLNKYFRSDSGGLWFLIDGLNRTFAQFSSLVRETNATTTRPTYSRPIRNIGEYNAAIAGVNSTDAYLLRVRAQRKGNWNPALMPLEANSWIRAGFNMAGSNPPACLADLNHDSAVNVDDLLVFLAAYQQGALAADLDNGSGFGTHDQGVDINDLLFFIQHYSSGC